MTSSWSYALAVPLGEIQGRFVLRRGDTEVGMISFDDSVNHQSMRLEGICDLLTFLDD